MSQTESAMRREVHSQPECWERALALVAGASGLPQPGERVAVVGCGTSAFLADSYAALRRAAGEPETDGWAASEFCFERPYDRIVAISRSGTTTEVLDLLGQLREGPGGPRVTAITADASAPIASLSDDLVAMAFADEESIVQTRSMTSVLLLLRASLGEDLTALPVRAHEALEAGPPPDEVTSARQWTFLGLGWTAGLADEAALKMREATQSWTESYSAMEYRHGPISIAQPGRVVWCLGAPPPGLAEQIRATGATFVDDDVDPVVDLVRVHLLSLAVAEDRGLDPDLPRHLSRSIILNG